jgi:hypothetical protein
LVRTTGNPANPIINPGLLFGQTAIGNLGLTNMQAQGQLASDQTFVVLALRAWLFFDGTNFRANYLGVTAQLYFTLTLGDKPQFIWPCWYSPAGGGVYGTDPTTGAYNLGYPSQNAILKLARPIVLPVRQNFSVTTTFFSIGTTNALTLLNTGASDDQKVIMVFLARLEA